MPGKAKRNRMWTYGSNTLISSVLFLGILIVVALVAERNPWRLDLTEAGTYSLSEQTRNILKSLDKPIQVKAFFATASPEQMKAKELLDTYRYYDNKMTYELVDPERQPEVANRYDIRAYGMVLEGYDKKQSIQTIDEENLTNAILKLSRKAEKKIYFLVGHGEHSIEDTAKNGYSSVQAALRKDNYVPAPLNLLQQAQVPDDAAALVIAGPKKPLLDVEIATLKAFLERGGKLLVFIDPYTSDPGLSDFLKMYGVVVDNDIVVDKLSRLFGGSYLMPVVTQYGPHKIVEGFNVATFFPEARSIRPAEGLPAGVQVDVLTSTSENAWGELDLDLISKGQAGFDEGKDIAGPVSLMVIAQINTAEFKPGTPEASKRPDQDPLREESREKQGKKSYLLVAGDSDFVDNSYFELSGNGDLFRNMVNFMAEEESLITIQSREKQAHFFMMTQDQAQAMLASVALMPLLVFASGLVVYRVRRSQR